MNAALLVQAAVIVLIVGWSVIFAARRLLPASSRRAQAMLAQWCDRPAAPRWLRQAAQRMQPKSTSGSSCASSGCSACGGCGAASAKAVSDAQPLAFGPHRRP
jgi:hypothetical protein